MRYQLATDDPLPPGDEDRDPRAPFTSILGRSSAIRRALDLAERASTRPSAPVLIVGEAGTGKELFARAIHGSSRARLVSEGQDEDRAPFLSLDCLTLPPSMIEGELFGRERPDPATGAPRQGGLLELAGAGTLLLDEADALPLDLQPKLLKVLEERKVRRAGGWSEVDVGCRLIAATSRGLEEALEDGRFRDDLYHRLRTARVWIPPLRERDGDIPILARHFLEDLAEYRGMEPPSLSPEALHLIEEHGWPGNVRELRDVLAEAVRRCDGEVILPEHVSLAARTRIRGGEEAAGAGFIPIPARGRTLESVEAEAVRITLERTGWNKSAAARILDISRPRLDRKIRKYGLAPGDGSGRMGEP